jgi:hypothetical protein
MYSDDTYSDTYSDHWVEDYLMLTLMGWSVMIVTCYAALAIKLA